MTITYPSTDLDESFCAAFFSTLESDVLVPGERSIEDRINATRAEIAGIARGMNKTEGERNIYGSGTAVQV